VRLSLCASSSETAENKDRDTEGSSRRARAAIRVNVAAFVELGWSERDRCCDGHTGAMCATGLAFIGRRSFLAITGAKKWTKPVW
jgi:hypothetical protein